MIGLICLGNSLHADDGFGTAVHRRLAARAWPGHVCLHDGSEGGVLDVLRQCRQAVLITALSHRLGPPGQVLRLTEAEIPADPQGPLGAGPASIVVAMRRLMQRPPETEILGAVAALQIPFSAGLTPLVAAAVETASAMLWRQWGMGQAPAV